MNPEKISHSPSSPEHLYQNYIIDVLVKDLKPKTEIKHPWYTDICDLIQKTNPATRVKDDTQIDHRLDEEIIQSLFETEDVYDLND